MIISNYCERKLSVKVKENFIFTSQSTNIIDQFGQLSAKQKICKNNICFEDALIIHNLRHKEQYIGSIYYMLK